MWSNELQMILRDFGDKCSDDLPLSLPPLRNLQHCIYFVSNASLLNLSHYKLNSKEH